MATSAPTRSTVCGGHVVTRPHGRSRGLRASRWRLRRGPRAETIGETMKPCPTATGAQRDAQRVLTGCWLRGRRGECPALAPCGRRAVKSPMPVKLDPRARARIVEAAIALSAAACLAENSGAIVTRMQRAELMSSPHILPELPRQRMFRRRFHDAVTSGVDETGVRIGVKRGRRPAVADRRLALRPTPTSRAMRRLRRCF